ncbi:hypothetical protein, partial [Acinetobacter baumannii]|uniref:hypothetical protein n=1 Tax=Acinetobacter baumannii TaxID=470 RepID=UPI0011787C1A
MDIVQKDHSKLKNIDITPFEQMHLKFCKFILGIRRNASNVGSRAELGRYPIFHDILLSMLTFWTRLLNIDASRLVKITYTAEYKDSETKGNWSQAIRKILQLFDN